MKFSSRGFTLVELMIVIAIIGILAAALFPSLTAYLKRSRDASRTANLNTIATAVNGFYSDREYYPVGAGSGCVFNTEGFASGTTAELNYFPKGLPRDPSQTTISGSPCNNVTSSRADYGYGSSGGTIPVGYTLSAILENVQGGNSTGYVLTGGAATNVYAPVKGAGRFYIITN